ncbi:MAG TPA: XRE family transcriptional regulator [Bacillota bacterium]|nr:XRE family transcriptional regulator [Bacillota bacterium]
MDIGRKIKELRIYNGLTQQELADRSELSKGFISQVERDLTSPSIATLMDILEALGTNIKDFFNEQVEEKIVFKGEDLFTYENEDLNHKIHWIVPNAQKNKMEPIIIELMAGGVSKVEDPHDGEEFGYVLSGSVTLHLGRKTYRVKKNEAFYFEPLETHYIKNAGKSKAKLLWVTTPPSF